VSTAFRNRPPQPRRYLGVNYIPSRAGANYWNDWDEPSIRQDAAAIAELGFEAIRFFLIWPDFQPDPATVAPCMLDRLKTLCRIAGEHGLLCMPTLFTIWLNGEIRDLPWRHGRSIWHDEEMLRAEETLARGVASALADSGNILAFDLADELTQATPGEPTPAQAAEWARRMADAIERGRPGTACLTSGNMSDLQLGLSSAMGLGLGTLGVHGYPVWSSLALESNRSAKAAHLGSFLVSLARVYGRVILDELAAYGCGPATAGPLVRNTTLSSLASGAEAVFLWCWQDIMSDGWPYERRPQERAMGVVDRDGHPKEIYYCVREVFGSPLLEEPVESWQPQVAIYTPRLQEPGSTYLDARLDSLAGLFYAHVLLEQAHIPHEFTALPREHHKLVVCPSVARLTLDDRAVLENYVAVGGCLYISIADATQALPREEFLGTELIDVRIGGQFSYDLLWGGNTYELPNSRAVNNKYLTPVLSTTTGTSIASFRDQSPAFISHTFGSGRVLTLAFPLELFLNQAGSLDATSWHFFYGKLADMAGVLFRHDCSRREVALADFHAGEDGYCLILNHSDVPVRDNFVVRDPDGQVAVAQEFLLRPREAVLTRLVKDRRRPGSQELPTSEGAKRGGKDER
jgi:beta-galactosidase